MIKMDPGSEYSIVSMNMNGSILVDPILLKMLEMRRTTNLGSAPSISGILQGISRGLDILAVRNKMTPVIFPFSGVFESVPMFGWI